MRWGSSAQKVQGRKVFLRNTGLTSVFVGASWKFCRDIPGPFGGSQTLCAKQTHVACLASQSYAKTDPCECREVKKVTWVMLFLKS